MIRAARHLFEKANPTERRGRKVTGLRGLALRQRDCRKTLSLCRRLSRST